MWGIVDRISNSIIKCDKYMTTVRFYCPVQIDFHCQDYRQYSGIIRVKVNTSHNTEKCGKFSGGVFLVGKLTGGADGYRIVPRATVSGKS